MKTKQRKVSLKKNPSLKKLQRVNMLIYGPLDDRYYDTWDIFSNQERFMMRALKGIRKGDMNKLKMNLIIAISWFLAIMNRLHVDLEEALWNRFPYVCSYCATCPCVCKEINPKKRPKSIIKTSKKPKTLKGYQEMFEKIYPQKTRTLEHEGIHMAEEQGELSEAIQLYLGSHNKEYFQSIIDESADYFSCIIGVLNSAKIDFEKEMMKFYSNNCHVCHNAPCTCDFVMIANFKS